MKRDRRPSHYLRWLPLGLLLTSAATQVLDDGHGQYSSMLHGEESFSNETQPNQEKNSGRFERAEPGVGRTILEPCRSLSAR